MFCSRHGRVPRQPTAFQRLVVIVTALVLATSACGTSGQESDEKQLVVASWGGAWTEYANKYFFEPFTKDTGIKVVVDTPGGGFAAQVRAQQQAGSVKWDILDGPGSDASALALVAGYGAKYPTSLVNKLKPLVRPGMLRPTPSNVYWLMYGQTSIVLACNPDMVKRCPKTPAQFWDVKQFPGTRGIAGYNAYEPMAYALMADGVAPDKLFPMDISRAMAKLRQIKPHVSVWPNSPSECQQVLADKEVGMAYCPNGRAFVVKQEVLPKLQISWNGAVNADEGWIVLKDAPHRSAAFKFVEWFAEHPKAQVQWTNKLSYMTPTNKLSSLVSPKVAPFLYTAHKDDNVAQLDGVSIAENLDPIAQAWKGFRTG